MLFSGRFPKQPGQVVSASHVRDGECSLRHGYRDHEMIHTPYHSIFLHEAPLSPRRPLLDKQIEQVRLEETSDTS